MTRCRTWHLIGIYIVCHLRLGKTIRKRACTSPGCGQTCTARYCLNSGQTETVGVACWRYDYVPNGYISTTFKVKATANSPPTISLRDGASMTINKGDYNVGDVINRVEYRDSDLHIGGDYIRYSIVDDSVFRPWDYANVSRTNDRLFSFNTGNGDIYVASDLSVEYSKKFTGIRLCIADRRVSGICITMTITLTACFEIPTCYDQENLEFWDTHKIGETLFTMTYPEPGYHFVSDFHHTWQDLTWSIVDTDLDVAEIVQSGLNGGILRTSANITVWPSWRYRDYFARIRVSNSESCSTRTCVMTFRIWFTNYPIRFDSLPSSETVHENFNDQFLVHQIYTHDQNNPSQDNVTCSMTFTPFEENLFELRHDGRYAYDSWSIHRLACQQRNCIDDCPKNIGCFTYGTTANHKFLFSVYCKDFYGSDVSGTFTLILEDNTPPSFTSQNEPVVYINETKHAKDSIVTQMYVSNPDSHQDNDQVKYWVTDDTKFIGWNYPNDTNTVRLFYLNTATGFIYVAEDLSLEYSKVFDGIEICMRDRRDTDICTTLTIVLTACFEIPTCYDQEKLDFWDTHPVGETLFEMKYPPPGYHFYEDFLSHWHDLTWSLDDTDLDVAEVVNDAANGGVLRTTANITVWPSWRYRDYFATISVSNSKSCGRTRTCVMTFRVWFTNYPIRFISLPNNITKHENVDGGFLAHQIITYDYNNPAQDNVTCSMSFVPYEDNLFTLEHDGAFSYNSWSIWRQACRHPKCEHHCPLNTGCFTYDTTNDHRFVFTVTCDDAYGSSVTDNFFVYLERNKPPYLTEENVDIVYITKETHPIDELVTWIYAADDDLAVDDDYIRWNITDDTKLIAWVYPNVTRTDRLFKIDGRTGGIYVAADLSFEYSYVFRDIHICIADRRDAKICRYLTINMTACFEIPTCYDQEKLDFWDTHPVGETLFEMKYPPPGYHFYEDFLSHWHDLTWSLDDTDLDVAEVVNDAANGGVLRTTANITVWPSWRYRDYFARIRVSNSKSCDTRTCVMTFRIWFTNYPIRFISLPNNITKHENVDGGFLAHQIITYDYNNPAQDNVTCSMSFEPYEDNLFTLEHDGAFSYNSWSIWRQACRHPKCEHHCPLNTGCFTYDTTNDHRFVFTVTCDDAYGSSVTDNFFVYLERNKPPYLTDANVDIVYITKETHPIDEFVTWIYAADDDLAVDDDYIRWNITDDTKLIAWGYPNATRTDRLFYIDGLTGGIYVAADLSFEYSYVFRDIQICIADRRDANICRYLTINMTACFEIPTCYDQEKLDFWDTHPVWDTLFTFTYPNPVYHFDDDFRDHWNDLTWSLVESDLDVAEVIQDGSDPPNGGLMRTVANITVWPSWRYRDYYAIIKVSNDESCGRVRTCVMTFRIWFKNWPIRFISLPDEATKNEDDNDAFEVHSIITYDYNFHEHDNVTCEMSFVPHEDNLFVLRHDGNFDYNSWSIHRLECQEKTCGFHCDKGIGCFTYNTTLNQQFVFTVHCWDAYDSEVTDTFTLHLDYNRAPVFHNLPLSITVNANEVLDGDVLHTIQYGDNENERMHFNYSISPNNGVWNDIPIFHGDVFGNYYDDQANITSTVYYHDMPTITYYIYICGTERRNMICETLIVNIKDYCPAHPTCIDDDLSLADTTAIGTLLFNINSYQDPSSGGTMSFSFISSTPSFFQIDQASGAITVAKELVAIFPSKTYQLTAFVYDSEACNYGSCQFTVTSTFTNHPISIVNLPFTYLDLSEDTELSEAIFVIETSDANTDDTVTCFRVSITSTQTPDPLSQDLFRVTQTYSGSNVWFIENRELPGFTAAITEYDILVECQDKYDSSDRGTLTVTIKPNETPTFINLDASITVDISVVGKDSIIFTVQTFDLENDALLFTWEVDSTFVPLALSDVGQVYLRRDLYIKFDAGATYSIILCINDTLHNLQPEVCGQLTVDVISSQKYPSISNLPDTVVFPEDTAGGTVLFDVDVYDENLDSVHTFTMTVDPPAAMEMFSLHAPTGLLRLQASASFNYEEQKTYTFTFAVKDQYLEGLDKKYLYLNITNVNEAPTIRILQDTITFDEDTIPLEILAKFVATCSDIDESDTQKFTIEDSVYSAFFSIDEDTSKLSLIQEWNMEDTMTTSTTLDISCSDAGGLKSTKAISISINPINEFEPVITPTKMTVHINSETTVVETLGEITSVTDADYGDDDTFKYDIVGVGFGRKYFTMTETGQLKLKRTMNLKSDKVKDFTISVSDEDYAPSARTAYCTVTANYTAPAEEIPEEPTYCTTCTTEGKIIMIGFAIEGLILCAIIAHIVHHVCTVCKEAQGVTEIRPQRFKSLGDANKTANVGNTTTSRPVGNTTTVRSPGNNVVNTSRSVGNATRIATVAGNANSTINPVTRPLQGVSVPQINAPSNPNNSRDIDMDSDSYDSVSDDSEIDERLQPFQPRNQALPSGIDAANVPGQFPAFGSTNYV